jgi:ASPIC and UnbV
MAMVGFGTQFLDGSLNGRLDLIVTNGHIGNFRKSSGALYRMPPQYYVNMGRGRFQLAPASSLGPYFQQCYLGRALARIDWNRDGLEDVIVTHLDRSVALLTNTTSAPGNFIALTLCGVQSNRDAIGTTVTAETASGRIMRQLTAGDGYMASNERRLVLGIGKETRVRRLTVRWPSGITRHYLNVPAGSEWILVEDRTRPFPIRQPKTR